MSDISPYAFGPVEPAPKVVRSRGIRGGRSARRKEQALQRYLFEVSAKENLYASPDDVPVLHSDGRSRSIVHRKASHLSRKNPRRWKLFHRLLRQS